MDHAKWMQQAIDAARDGLAAGQSPFGCVIVRDGKLLASGHNEVWKRTDPTAHAEMVAIQRAASALRGIDLSGSVLYSTCEPCPMCASAIHWARFDEIVYGASIADAETAGFNELHVSIATLYGSGGSAVRVTSGVLATQCAALFGEYRGLRY